MKMKRALTFFLWVSFGFGAWFWAGCAYEGNGFECDTTEDLDREFFDGAVCIDGAVGCDNGAEFCSYMKPDSEGKMRLKHGCFAEHCIRCEKGEYLCVFWSDDTADGNDWVACYQRAEDCGGGIFSL